MPGKLKKVPKSKQPSTSVLPKNSKHNQTQPYAIGAKLLTSVRWFELSQQMRIKKDKAHQAIIERLYHGLPITQVDIKDNYKLVTKEELSSKEWIEAPIVVATNRERLTLIEERARQYAAFHGTYVLRWQRDMKNWEQLPLCQRLAVKSDLAFTRL
jgi:hypothetical protein